MHVVVCIVGYRNLPDIERCVAALGESTHRDLEVVICENGGAQAHAALTARLPGRLAGGQTVTIIEAADNPGYAGGINRCIEARPEADAWWMLNPDTVPEPGALAALVSRLQRGDCAAAGGVLHDGTGHVQAYGGRWRGWLARAESIGRGARIDAPVDAAAVEAAQTYISGASMLIGRRFVDTAGLMRDDYFLYCEEVEWCVRAQQRGLRLGFAPDSRVLHHQGATTGSATTLDRRPRMPIYLDERNKLHVIRDTTPAHLPVAAVMTLLLLTLRFARRGAWAQWRYALSGWWAGLRGQRGKPA